MRKHSTEFQNPVWRHYFSVDHKSSLHHRSVTKENSNFQHIKQRSMLDRVQRAFYNRSRINVQLPTITFISACNERLQNAILFREDSGRPIVEEHPSREFWSYTFANRTKHREARGEPSPIRIGEDDGENRSPETLICLFIVRWVTAFGSFPFFFSFLWYFPFWSEKAPAAKYTNLNLAVEALWTLGSGI